MLRWNLQSLDGLENWEIVSVLAREAGAIATCGESRKALRLIRLDRLEFTKLCQNVDGFALAN